MATYSIDEALSLIKGYLDKVSEEARSYMSSYIAQHADKGYQTGALANSIDVQNIGDNARSVGSSLKSKSGHVYGKYVDKGRGPIEKAHGYLQYYDPKLDRWVKTKRVSGISGIDFLKATKDYLESKHIPL